MVIPKLTVSNYPEMLRKLSTGTFFVTLACLFLLRALIGDVDSLLRALDVITRPVSLFEAVRIPFGPFLFAFLVAVLTESIKLHDKISNLLKIRLEFDIRYILMPMALLSSSPLKPLQLDKLSIERRRLMDEVFYKYASSSSSKQVIDGHAITQALTSWSWYWLCAESIVILILTVAALVYANQTIWGLILLGIVLLLTLLMRIFRLECSKYAGTQVRQIVNDPERQMVIAETFDAL